MVHAESPRDSVQQSQDEQGAAPEKLQEITNLVKNAGECTSGAVTNAQELSPTISCAEEKALTATASGPQHGAEPAGTIKNTSSAENPTIEDATLVTTANNQGDASESMSNRD